MIGDLEEARKAYFAAGGIPSDIPDRGLNWYQRLTVVLLQRKNERLRNTRRVALAGQQGCNACDELQEQILKRHPELFKDE